jgi:hypothetical protein
MGICGPAPSSLLGGSLLLLKHTGSCTQVRVYTGFLRMRGLLLAANRKEVSKFFTGYNESFVLTYRNDGCATGEAYILHWL